MRRKLLMEILVLPVFFYVITACEESPALSSDATVSAVSIGEVRAQSLGTPNTNWMAVVPGDIYLSHSQLSGAVSASADSGAKIYYAKGAAGAQPYFAEEPAMRLDHEDLVWIEVFSANLDQYLIYAIKVHKRTPVLSGLTLAYQYPEQTYSVTHSYGLNLGTPGASADDPALVPGEIWYGKTQSGNTLTVAAQPEMADSTVVVSGSADFDTPAAITAADDSYFYIRSTSGLEEEGETIYYKIKLVQKNDNLSLVDNKVVINGVDATAGRMGAHSLVGQEAWGSFNDGAALDNAGYVNINTTAETASNPVSITVNLADSTGVTVEYGHTSNDRDYLIDNENWSAANNLGVLPTNEYVALRLTSELGVRGWYKFRVRIGRTGIGLGGITIDDSQISAVPDSNAQVTGTAAVDYTMSAAGPWQTVNVTAALDDNSGGAQIAYAVAPAANTNTVPTAFTGTGSFSEVSLAHYVVIRVVSENGQNTGYYKIRLVYGDTDATLSAITIGGAALDSIPEPNPTADGDNAVRYQMSAAGPWDSVTVAGTPTSGNATAAYASASTVNATIDDAAWSTSGTLSNISSGGYVCIRVTSEAGTSNYYKIRLVYGSGEAALSSVAVGGATASSVGSPGVFDMAMYGAYNGFPGTVTLTPEQAGDGSEVTVAATASEGATVRYNWGGGMNFGFGMSYYLSDAANWNDTGQGLFAGGLAAYFISVPAGVNGAFIVIEVTSQDGTAVNVYAVSCSVSE